MDKTMIENITRLVIEKMTAPDSRYGETRVIDYVNGSGQKSDSTKKEQPPQPHPSFSTTSGDSSDELLQDPADAVRIEKPDDLQALEEMVRTTPARIAIGRAGTRPKTRSLLRFQADHAAAVDAVYGDVDESLLRELDLFTVETLVETKEEYIRRPDLGRRLRKEHVELIKQRCKLHPQVQIIISDGLSSQALEANLKDVFHSLQQSLKTLGLETGTPFFIKKGRVALMDEIGEILQTEAVVYLIGERPGLVTARSLSAYLCYKPRFGTIEAERMVISNIHQGGTPPVEAGAHLGYVVQKILKYQASGVSLIQKEG
jgi:ethanolamine ammonia-lyase small subunit